MPLSIKPLTSFLIKDWTSLTLIDSILVHYNAKNALKWYMMTVTIHLRCLWCKFQAFFTFALEGQFLIVRIALSEEGQTWIFLKTKESSAYVKNFFFLLKMIFLMKRFMTFVYIVFAWKHALALMSLCTNSGSFTFSICFSKLNFKLWIRFTILIIKNTLFEIIIQRWWRTPV